MPADERRATIVAAATPLVRRYGRGVTTSQIAAAAEVSEGTLFHVFPDKDAIIDAVVEVELRTDHVLAELEAVDADADLRTRVVTIVEVLRRRLGSVFELMTAVGMTRPPARLTGPRPTPPCSPSSPGSSTSRATGCATHPRRPPRSSDC